MDIFYLYAAIIEMENRCIMATFLMCWVKNLLTNRTRVRFPAGRPWSCIFRNWSRFGSYNVYLIDTRISNT